jgi:putative transposase
VCHDILDFYARVLAILAEPNRHFPSARLLCRRGDHDRVMATAARTQRRYDHRLRKLVRTTRDIHCALQRDVPRSTARGWLTEPDAPIVTVDAVDMDVTQLQRELLQLRRRIRKLTALLRVLLVVFKISGYSLNQSRLQDGSDKRLLLQAIERSRLFLPLRALLRVIRLSPSRYHAWNGEDQCALDDGSSCPRSSPRQLTAAEVGVIHELVTSDDYRHVPTGTLARLAQRIAKVYASASTWYRLVREHRWRRPRQRVHPGGAESRDSRCPAQ